MFCYVLLTVSNFFVSFSLRLILRTSLTLLCFLIPILIFDLINIFIQETETELNNESLDAIRFDSAAQNRLRIEFLKRSSNRFEFESRFSYSFWSLMHSLIHQ